MKYNLKADSDDIDTACSERAKGLIRVGSATHTLEPGVNHLRFVLCLWLTLYDCNLEV